MLSEVERKAVKLAYLLWKNIDFENMKRSRLVGIWDEFEGKVKYAAYNGPERFLEVFCRKMSTGVPKHAEMLVLIEPEVLEVLIWRSKRIMTLLRFMIEREREKLKTTEEKKVLRKHVDELIAETEREFEELMKGGAQA